MPSVLIADDYPDTVEIMQNFLEAMGFETVAAYDGAAAIEVANRVRPASIVLDVRLPILNGFEVSRTLRQSRKFDDTYIIGCSGYVGLEFYDQASKAGMDFYLPKPIEPEVLAACLAPEKHVDFFAGNIADLSRNLQERSLTLQAKAQALSERSSAALRRAQEIIQATQSSMLVVRGRDEEPKK